MSRTGWTIAASVAFSTAMACSWQQSSSEFSRTARPAPLPDRADALARAKVWAPTLVEKQNIKAGPDEPGTFQFLETVRCNYEAKAWQGHSSKFACDVGSGDPVKVKFGSHNGEVYGEVAATRLLWALGFGADRMYPVRILCRGCPDAIGGLRQPSGEILFDPAVVEREMPGAEFPDQSGWAWPDLDLVDEQAGGATRAERDALKLIAVLVQHTDNKSEQQRLICRDEPRAEWPAHCERPFMLLNDVGLTFGRANSLNENAFGGANLTEWARTRIWKDPDGCTGNLQRSLTGTMADPVISEEGRRFLAQLLERLSDRQIRDLFEVSRVQLRPPSPDRQTSGESRIDDWVMAFNQKRAEIVTRRCP